MRKQSIAHVVILFYLLSTLLSTAHIHDDIHTLHSDCKICIVSNAMLGSDISSPTNYVTTLSIYLPKISVLEDNPLVVRLKGFHSQAPPSFS